MRRLKPEFIFVGLIVGGMLTGIAMTVSGVAPQWGYRVAFGAFALGWVPALLALVFIAIPEWWRKR